MYLTFLIVMSHLLYYSQYTHLFSLTVEPVVNYSFCILLVFPITLSIIYQKKKMKHLLYILFPQTQIILTSTYSIHFSSNVEQLYSILQNETLIQNLQADKPKIIEQQNAKF